MITEKKNETKSVMLLLFASMIWGTAFVFQKTGMKYLGPFAFNFFRCLMALIFLLFVNIFWTRSKKREQGKSYRGFRSKALFLGGVLSGIALFFGLGFQQMGMVTSEASKAGFITTMYIVIVPVMGIFYGRKSGFKTWICVFIAAVGLYMLSIKNGFEIHRGDFLIFISAIFYALQIVMIDIFAPKADTIKLSIIECSTTGILSFAVMMITEHTTWNGIMGASVGILYTGILSLGVGFTIQIFAQRNLTPSVSSLLMSMESVFSVVAGSVFLGEKLTRREYIGCVIMFIAIILAQINMPERKRYKKDKNPFV